MSFPPYGYYCPVHLQPTLTTDVSLSASTGGSLSASTKYFWFQYFNRAGGSLFSSVSTLVIPSSGKVTATIEATALVDGEDLRYVIIYVNTTNTPSTACQVARIEVWNTNQLTLVGFPLTLVINQNSQLELNKSVATSASLPSSNLLNGFLCEVLADGKIYRVDKLASSGVYAASGGGYWVEQDSYGFNNYLTDVANSGGFAAPIASIESALLTPNKEDNADSIESYFAFGNGLTDDGGSDLPIGTNLNLEISIDGSNTYSDGFGRDLSYLPLFNGLIEIRLIGYYKHSDRSLDTVLVDVNAPKLWYAESSPLVLLDPLPRGYSAIYGITLKFTSQQLKNRIAENSVISIDIVDNGNAGVYAPEVWYLTGNAIFNDGNKRLVIPSGMGLVIKDGVGIIEKYRFLSGDSVVSTGLVADTENQLVAISGSAGGECRIVQDEADLLGTEAIRAYVSTIDGYSPISTSASITVSANAKITVTILATTAIRSDYPDSRIASLTAQNNASVGKIYLVKSGIYYAQGSFTPGSVTQNIELTSLGGTTTVPSHTGADFGLFKPAIATLAESAGLGSIGAGTYQVILQFEYPSPNLKVTKIDHDPALGCIDEINASLSEVATDAPYYKQPVSTVALMRSLPANKLVDWHLRVCQENNSSYLYDPTNTDPDDGVYTIAATNGTGNFIQIGSGNKIPVESWTGTVEIWVDSASGLDTNSGLTNILPVKTINKAIEILSDKKIDDNSGQIEIYLKGVFTENIDLRGVFTNSFSNPRRIVFQQWGVSKWEWNPESITAFLLPATNQGFYNQIHLSGCHYIAHYWQELFFCNIYLFDCLVTFPATQTNNDYCFIEAYSCQIVVVDSVFEVASPGYAWAAFDCRESFLEVSNCTFDRFDQGIAIVEYGSLAKFYGCTTTNTLTSSYFTKLGTVITENNTFDLEDGQQTAYPYSRVLKAESERNPIRRLTTSDPTINDDRVDGFYEGDEWINSTDDGIFINTDQTVGAAVWKELMTKDVYDSNNNGIVDNSTQLNSQAASYYLAKANFTGVDRSAIATLTDAANISVDASLSNNFTVTLANNRTIDNPTNLVNGANYSFIIKQDATGSRTLTWGSAYKFAGGTDPTLTTAANAVDLVTFLSDGTNLYNQSVILNLS